MPQYNRREVPQYDEAAVEEAKKMMNEMGNLAAGQGCPGSRFMELKRNEDVEKRCRRISYMPVTEN